VPDEAVVNDGLEHRLRRTRRFDALPDEDAGTTDADPPLGDDVHDLYEKAIALAPPLEREVLVRRRDARL
jgi:hypothetical protein